MLGNKYTWFIISMIFGATALVLWLVRFYIDPKSDYYYSILWPIGANVVQFITLKTFLIIDKKDINKQ